MIAALAPFVRMAKRRVNRIKCANNLRQISLALHNYAADNNSIFPATLEALYPNYITNEMAFDCPAAKEIGTKDMPDYIYTTGLTENSGLKDIIVQDKSGSHKKAGRNVLRVDGSVEWITSAR